MKKLTVNEKHIKSYTTAKNLEKALSKLNLPESVAYLETWTESGRVTAVFTNVTQDDHSMLLTYIANKGFMVVG